MPGPGPGPGPERTSCSAATRYRTNRRSKRQASTEPRFAYAFVCETGQNYEHVSLVDTLEQIHALEEEFRTDCAYEFEQEDAYCTWLGVALPRLKKTSP